MYNNRYTNYKLQDSPSPIIPSPQILSMENAASRTKFAEWSNTKHFSDVRVATYFVNQHLESSCNDALAGVALDADGFRGLTSTR